MFLHIAILYMTVSSFTVIRYLPIYINIIKVIQKYFFSTDIKVIHLVSQNNKQAEHQPRNFLKYGTLYYTPGLVMDRAAGALTPETPLQVYSRYTQKLNVQLEDNTLSSLH